MAHLERAVPIHADTAFESGSVAKEFTATVLLLLAQQDKISLDDPLRKYLPELPDYGAPLTVRHILSHTGGLREWRLVARLSSTTAWTYVLDNQDLFRIAAKQRALDFDSGTAYSYAKTGFNLASLLLERVLNNGTTFQEFTKKAIFVPFGDDPNPMAGRHSRHRPEPSACQFSQGRRLNPGHARRKRF